MVNNLIPRLSAQKVSLMVPSGLVWFTVFEGTVDLKVVHLRTYNCVMDALKINRRQLLQ